MADQEQSEPRNLGPAEFAIESIGVTKIALADGTRVLIQTIPTACSRTDQKLPDGQPMFLFQMQQVVQQLEPDDKLLNVLRKGV